MNVTCERRRIEAQSGIAVTLSRGDLLAIVDLEGAQVADLFAIAASDPGEMFSSGRTIDYNETIRLRSGMTLYSNRSSPMFVIVEDDVGIHDLLLTPCSARMFELLRGVREHPSCHANLAAALEPYGLRGDAIGATFNIFMNVEVAADGRIRIEPPRSRAGDRIVLRAEMDVVAGITACSSEYTNGGTCKPVGIEIVRASR